MSEQDKDPRDLAQAATGEGFDPDQAWDDEPDEDLPDVDDPDDYNLEVAEVE